jgi:hypothetical protein
MRLIALAGIVTGLTLGAAGSAGAVVLHQQVPPAGEFVSPIVASHDHADDSLDAQAADDFTIGDGQVWRVQSVDVLGAAPSSDSHTASVTLLAEAGGLPALPVFSESGIAVAGCCDFTAYLAAPPSLRPGTYWLTVQTSGGSPWQWQVHTPDATYGAPALWQNPGNGSGRSCTTWTPFIDCNLVAAGDGKDLIFALAGTLTDSRFSVVRLAARGFRLFATVGVPATGTMRIGGRGVKKGTKQLATGEQRLRVRLKGGVLDRLRSGRNAKVRVKLTFTATGGDGFTQREKAKLVPVGRARSFRVAR